MSVPKPRNPTKSTQPEIEPARISPPKKFPENPEPIASKDNEDHQESSGAPSKSGSGEDPLVESGLPPDDPEQPRETDEEKSMQ
jgi:hypothetical protein